MKDIRKKFFGTYDIPDSVIITPIKRIYESIALDGKKEYMGWWNSKTGDINGKRYFVSKIPQRGTIDAVLSLNDSRILLIGYCGSTGKLRIGETVCSSACLNVEETELPTLDWKPFNPVLTCHSDALLLENENFLESARLKGIEAIDMETFDFYKYCRLSDNVGMSILIVTDIPGKKNFYEIKEDDENAVRSGIIRVSEGLGRFT